MKHFSHVLPISILFVLASCSMDSNPKKEDPNQTTASELHSTTPDKTDQNPKSSNTTEAPPKQKFITKQRLNTTKQRTPTPLAPQNHNVSQIQEEYPICFAKGQQLGISERNQNVFATVKADDLIDGNLYGTMINAETNQEASNEEVWLINNSGILIEQDKTTKNGNFVFTGLTNQSYQLMAYDGHKQFKYKPNPKPFGDNTAQVLYDKALLKYDKSENTSSEALVDKSLAINSQSYDANMLKGKLLEAKGDNDGALKYYAIASNLNNGGASAFYKQGMIKSQQEKYPQALADFTKAIQSNPNDADAYFQRGLVYNNMNQNTQALRDYEQFLKMKPNYAPALFNLGSTYANLGDFENAASAFSRTLEITPNDPDCYLYRGMCEQQLSKNNLALADFDKAIELNKSLDPYLRKAEVLEDEREFSKAEQNYEEAIRHYPKEAILYCHRGIFFGNRKKYDQAIEDFNKAISLDNKNGEYYADRAQIYMKMKKKTESCSDIAMAKQLRFKVDKKLEEKACK